MGLRARRAHAGREDLVIRPLSAAGPEACPHDITQQIFKNFPYLAFENIFVFISYLSAHFPEM